MVLSLQHGLQPSNLAVQSGFLLTAYDGICVSGNGVVFTTASHRHQPPRNGKAVQNPGKNLICVCTAEMDLRSGMPTQETAYINSETRHRGLFPLRGQEEIHPPPASGTRNKNAFPTTIKID